MKTVCITIKGFAPSEEAADRCIASGRQFGIEVRKVWAITPANGPADIFKLLKLRTEKFTENPYSKPENAMACFLSHWNQWDECVDTGEPVLILEHDAVFVAPIPKIPPDVLACNFGRPSFGRYSIPPDGFSPLQSKPSPHYLPGAHAYYITPIAAVQLLQCAHSGAEPTDVYLNRLRFHFFQEYHPWPVICEDSFSTVQREEGCKAKHREVEPVDIVNNEVSGRRDSPRQDSP